MGREGINMRIPIILKECTLKMRSAVKAAIILPKEEF